MFVPLSEKSCRYVRAVLQVCTYVTDMCVLSLARGKEVDMSDMFDVLVSFLVHEDINLCDNF